MRTLLLLLLIVPFTGSAQNWTTKFPRDTSFSVNSAYKKAVKKYPEITPVTPFSDLNIVADWNVVYCAVGKRELHADVFYPKQKLKKKCPGVLLIHGGGWASGNKSHLVPLAQKLAAAGYITASIEYRLSPEAIYPTGVIDLKTAVKWFKIQANNYRLDTSRIAVLGTSAGATLATLLGTTGNTTKFSSHFLGQRMSDKVHAIVNMDGVLDFTDPAESGKDDDPNKPSAGARWFGATFKEKPELWIEGSPNTYVSKNTPPTLFVNSSLPRFHAGRDKYLDTLKRYDIYNEVHTIEDTPHPYWLFHPWFDEAFPIVKNFLSKVFETTETK